MFLFLISLLRCHLIAAKKNAAMEMGADNFVVSSDEKSMAGAADSLDILINTVSANHDATMYFPLLARRGVEVMIGATANNHKVG